MITRAQIEEELAKYDNQPDQYQAVALLLQKELPASPVVNGPLAEYMNSEKVSLADVILADLHTYRNWIRNE